MRLPAAIAARLDALSEAGNAAFDAGAMGKAIEQWSRALELLPEPRVDWEAWTWLKASIGDAYLALGNPGAGEQALRDALNGPGGPGNAFVHFRLGQSLMAQGRTQEAHDPLLRAYMLDGETIFRNDPQGERALGLLRHAGLVD